MSFRTLGEIAIAVTRLNPADIAAFYGRLQENRRHFRTSCIQRRELPDDRQRRCDSTADQARSEPVPPPRQPALDRTHRPAQRLSRLLVRQALKVAEDNHYTVALWQEAQFLIEHRLQVHILVNFAVEPALAMFGITTLMEPATVGRRPGRACHTVGHALEPTCNRFTVSDGTGIANQYQKRGLKRILNIMRVAQDATTGRQDHSRVPLQQHGECQFRPLAPLFDESFQKLRVRQSAQSPLNEERAGMTQERGHLLAVNRHETVSKLTSSVVLK